MRPAKNPHEAPRQGVASQQPPSIALGLPPARTKAPAPPKPAQVARDVFGTPRYLLSRTLRARWAPKGLEPTASFDVEAAATIIARRSNRHTPRWPRP
jgi:hypothetical protein